ncbi:MAG: T9SS type A sorting domain-containing protein [Mariniphaga sp.]|nr:T9SS type A sorting domain-containing protein [Mariniphaga sp.]
MFPNNKLSKLTKAVLSPFSRTKSAIFPGGVRNFLFGAAGLALMALSPSIASSQVLKVAESVSQKSISVEEDYSLRPGNDPYSQPNIHIKLGRDSLDYEGPKNWDDLKRNEKIKAGVERAKENIKHPLEGYLCGDHTNRFQINFTGAENLENWSKYSKFEEHIENAKENIPFYLATTFTKDGVAHAIPCFFVGSENSEIKDDPTDFNQWYFFDYRGYTNDGEGNKKDTIQVVPGDGVMDENSPVQISYFRWGQDAFGNWNHADSYTLSFDLQDSVATLTQSPPEEFLIENPHILNVSTYFTNPNARSPATNSQTVNYTSSLDAKALTPAAVAQSNTIHYQDSIKTNEWYSDTIPVNPACPNVEFDIIKYAESNLKLGRWIIGKEAVKIGEPRSPEDTIRYITHVRDLEASVFTLIPEDIVVTFYQDGRHLTPDSTGHATATDNSCIEPKINYNYVKTEEDDAKAVYRVEFTAEDNALETNYSVSPNYQYVTAEKSTGIEDLKLQNNFNLYPNPTNGKLNLEYEVSKPQEMNWKLYNLQGKLMDYNFRELVPGGKDIPIDISSYKDGIYILKLDSEERKQSYKIVKQ